MKVNKPAAEELEVVVDDVPAGTGPDVVVTDDQDGDELPHGAVRNPDRTITYTFGEPVTLTVKRGDKPVSQEVFSSLTFHPMTGADLMAIINTSDDARMSVVVARSARMSQVLINKVLQKMDARDASACSTCAGFFVRRGRRTSG